ncbi:MAG: hypothetical protein HeimC3_45240 [Candidatus Heimdallarchaeota archaeon LC_3]|nr:MAG: hypothetical protein HeimC3_45240 [Candidatus Heimdallarchaeota archaeon LC_3]
MSFPLVIYVPGYNDLGIRVGDLISLLMLVTLLICFSDIEDRRLRKKFPESFQDYYENTGFFSPKIINLKISDRFSLF